MITDNIVGAWLDLMTAIMNLLPDMPEKPEAFNAIWSWFSMGLWFLPVDDLRAFAPAFFGTLGMLVVVRLVRAFLPGG